MAFEVLVTRGAWRLMRSRDSTPQWVGWVHESAEGWRREVVRILEAAERAGIDGPNTATGAYLTNQRLFTRDLHVALGQLARALDLWMSAFEPWARGQWKWDPGPDPWPGWNLRRALWRADVTRAAQAGTPEVAAAPSVLVELWYRVRLSEAGLLVPPAPGAPADVWMTLEAPETRRGVDTRASSCFAPTDVEPDFRRPPPVSARSVWNCVNYSAWWPGAGAAEQDVWVSALVPLRWHWRMAAAAARRVRELGSVEALVAACRAWIAMKNLAAVAAVERLTGQTFDVPEELIEWTAGNTGPGDWSDTEAHGLLMTASSMVSQAGPVGALIGLGIQGLDLIAQEVGTARGYWLDPWERREVHFEEPRLTGILDVERPEPPTHDVRGAPVWAEVPVEAPGATGPTLAERRRAARAGSARVVGGLRDRVSGPAPSRSSKGKKSGGAGKAVAAGAGLYILAKLLGG